MSQGVKQDNRDILEQLPYVNELMVAVRNVNDAILNGKDAREAAENLMSDLPLSWSHEIHDAVKGEQIVYDTTVEVNNRFLSYGCTSRQKYLAQKAIVVAGNKYSRNIKKIVLTLLDGKGLLFKTRAKLDVNNLSLYSVGEGDINEPQ